MPDRDRTREILLELSRSGTDLAGLPLLLVQLCARALPVTGVGLTLMTGDDNPAGMVAATDGPAAELENLQFTLGEGPCVQASRTGRPVLVPDLANAHPTGAGAPWPMFTHSALAAGVAAIFAFPLRIGAIRIGVLDLYRARTGPLDPADVDEALAFAEAAITVVLHVHGNPPPQASTQPTELWTLPLADDRAVVHQATGVVSVTAQVSLGQALVLVRARAYAEQRPVNDVAADIVERRLHLGPPDGAGSPP